MKNIKEILQKATELESLARARAGDIMNIDGYGYKYNYLSSNFYNNDIAINFVAERDYYDVESISISLDQLEMTDEEWKNHINQLKEDISKKKNKE
jgi:hypothetical protein